MTAPTGPEDASTQGGATSIYEHALATRARNDEAAAEAFRSRWLLPDHVTIRAIRAPRLRNYDGRSVHQAEFLLNDCRAAKQLRQHNLERVPDHDKNPRSGPAAETTP